MTTPVENEHFELVEVDFEDGKWNAIKLLEEPFDGIMYRYDWVKPPKPGTDDFTFSFGYTMMENPNVIEEDSTFTNLLGDVIVEIISSELSRREQAEDGPDTKET